MNNSIKIIVFFLFTCAFHLAGQAQVNDAGLWAGINLEKKLNKKIAIGLSQEFRFYENITELGSYLTEVSGEYRFNKMIGISAGYRFTNRRRVDDTYSKRHRFLANLVVKKKFYKINTTFRIRYQSQFSDIYTSEEGRVPDNYIRTKLTLKYDTDKRIVPFVSGELFFQTNLPDGVLCDNYRVTAGLEYEFNKQSSFELGYLVNREINVNDPWTNYVIAISWNYKLK